MSLSVLIEVHLQQSIVSSSLVVVVTIPNELVSHHLVSIIPRRLGLGLCVVTGLVLVGGHVPGQVVPLPETLVANRALQFVLPLPSLTLGCSFALVVRPHVVHQVAGHPEADVALGTHVLGGQ